MSERLPPIASTVLRSVDSNRSLRCSSRDMASWLTPSSRATLAWVSSRLAQLAQRHLLSDELRGEVLDLAALGGVEPRDHVLDVRSITILFHRQSRLSSSWRQDAAART